MRRIQLLITVFAIVIIQQGLAGDGYELWLRYDPIQNQKLVAEYSELARSLYFDKSSPTLEIIVKEFRRATYGMLTKEIKVDEKIANGSILILRSNHKIVSDLGLVGTLATLGKDGFLLKSISLQGKACILVTGNEETGLLYGSFHFLRLLRQEKPIRNLNFESRPSIDHRILNHWDNLDRTVERGYAGFSLWDWHRLPDYIDERYHDYARANASIGINGSVLTNVNANALVLTEPYLKKVKALADVFRPYGMKVYLTARFSAPMEIGGLPSADPLDKQVQEWWDAKAREIYSLIPDFGGFVVKANSEGQPGPQNYGRSHADGANVLAKALQAFKGIVMWRAFVYSNEVPTDRVKQAYNEFKPLDGKFEANVLVQVKNGPLDFQPREPFHPLFGAMKKTPLSIEFQLTQEYLGFATHLVYLGSLFSEVLQSDTRQQGAGSTVRKAIDGSLYGHSLSAVAGVANIGSDRNWCGHPFAQANWYAYGKLAWNPGASPGQIAEEWTMQTFSSDQKTVKTITDIMMTSRETLVNYMTPLGLHHIMGYDHHYGPAPWIKEKPRVDWTSVYYHKADSNGVGFNRSSSGSNALEQYHPEVASVFENPGNCPEEFLLWFHHLPWTHKVRSGRTLWEEMCYRYYSGATQVADFQEKWNSLKGSIDDQQFLIIKSLLGIQYNEACWWRDACLLYFESVSGNRLPSDYTRPAQDLRYFQSLQFPYAPGIRPRW